MAKESELSIGTPVEIVGGYAIGVHGTVVNSYTIRFGHHMYDVKGTFGETFNYYGPEQLRVLA